MISSAHNLISIMGMPVTKQQAAHYCLFTNNLGRLRTVLRNTNEMLLSMSPEASETVVGNGEIILYQTPKETAEEQYLKFLFSIFFNNVCFLNIDEYQYFLQEKINGFVFDNRVSALDREDTVIVFYNLPPMNHLDYFFANNLNQIAPYLMEVTNNQISEKEAFDIFQKHFVAVAGFILRLIYPDGFQDYSNEVVLNAIQDKDKHNPLLPNNIASLKNSDFAQLSVSDKCLLGEIAWRQSDCELLLKVLRMDGGSYYAAFQQYYKPIEFGGLGFYPDNIFAFDIVQTMNASKVGDEFLDAIFQHQGDVVRHENLFAMTHHVATLFPNFIQMLFKHVEDEEAQKIIFTILNLREFYRAEKSTNE